MCCFSDASGPYIRNPSEKPVPTGVGEVWGPARGHERRCSSNSNSKSYDASTVGTRTPTTLACFTMLPKILVSLVLSEMFFNSMVYRKVARSPFRVRYEHLGALKEPSKAPLPLKSLFLMEDLATGQHRSSSPLRLFPPLSI